MKRGKFVTVLLSVFVTVVSTWVANAAPLKSDSIRTNGGAIVITPIFHASTQIEYGGKVILVDPVSAGSYRKKADLVLITHTHPDHLNTATIAKVHKPGTIVIIPRDAIQATSALVGTAKVAIRVMTKGQTLSAGGITVQAVPAYNVVRGPKAGQKFHPRGSFNGYVLSVGNKRLYFAGDTENTPEMRRLKNIDAAFLPMNLPFTMTPKEAASAAKAFRPRVVYPYHFRYPFNKPNDNPQQFAAALKGTGIQVRLLDFYPAAAVQKAAAGG